LTVTVYPVLEFVVSDFLSNKALLLSDLYKTFEDLVDKIFDIGIMTDLLFDVVLSNI
jgi:hypothetical protein